MNWSEIAQLGAKMAVFAPIIRAAVSVVDGLLEPSERILKTLVVLISAGFISAFRIDLFAAVGLSTTVPGAALAFNTTLLAYATMLLHDKLSGAAR